MKTGVLPWLVLAAGACGVTEQRRSLPGEVRIAVADPYGMLGPETRVGVVWTLDRGFWVRDRDIVPLGADGAVLSLVAPPVEVASLLAPIESIDIGAGVPVAGYRPRIVVFQDRNGNGVFEPGTEARPGADTVVGVDRGPLYPAYLPALDDALARLRLEQTEAFYATVDERYSSFVTVDGRVSPLQLSEAAPVVVTLSDSEVPAADFACMRSPLVIRGGGLFPTSRATAYVDPSLDPFAVCGAVFPECFPTALEGLEPLPAFTTFESDATLRVVQCRASDRLDALVVHLAELSCDGCECTTTVHARVYLVAPEARPTWWPCGPDGVPYCVSDVPLYAIDPACVGG